VRVLITGSSGQLGRALAAAAPRGEVVKACTHAELDIADETAVAALWRDFAPDLVINAAAFTQVDAAEGAPRTAERANAHGPAVLAANHQSFCDSLFLPLVVLINRVTDY